MQSRELVKLYYRIGEVSDIVGVQPHVLRYWETEFRSIRPQKSSKGQRVYSRRDVEKLLRVKDLLKNQGFTIAGARKRLSEPAPASAESPAPEPAGAAPVPETETGAKAMRKTLLSLRHDLMRMLEEITERKER
jgi:DNA-binding transcriptional MerR regulator